jgi:uncharacterized membrane protein YkgB
MSLGQKEKRPGVNRGVHQTVEATKQALATGLGAVWLLVAFSCLRGAEQLLLGSVGGLLVGGLK